MKTQQGIMVAGVCTRTVNMTKNPRVLTPASVSQRDSDAMNRLLTVKAIASLLALSDKAVYELVWNGDLSHYRLGTRCIRISEEHLREFLARSEESALTEESTLGEEPAAT